MVTPVTPVTPISKHMTNNNDNNNNDFNNNDYNNVYCNKCNQCNISIYENKSLETQCYTGFEKPEPLGRVWEFQEQCNMGFLGVSK